LNLMVRRDAFRADVETVHLGEKTRLGLDGDTVIVFVATGQVEVIAGGDGIERLGPLDALRIDAPLPSPLILRSDIAARIQVLRLWPSLASQR